MALDGLVAPCKYWRKGTSLLLDVCTSGVRYSVTQQWSKPSLVSLLFLGFSGRGCALLVVGGFSTSPFPLRGYGILSFPQHDHLYSSIMLLSGASPMQARSTFSNMARCFARAFTTGAPSGTKGAFVK